MQTKSSWKIDGILNPTAKTNLRDIMSEQLVARLTTEKQILEGCPVQVETARQIDTKNRQNNALQIREYDWHGERLEVGYTHGVERQIDKIYWQQESASSSSSSSGRLRRNSGCSH